MESRLISEDGIRGKFYPGDGKARRAIIALGGSAGGIPYDAREEVIAPLIELGNPLLCLAYFGIEGLPLTLQRIPLEYFERAITWLSTQANVIPGEYILFGGSRGGELALLLASMNTSIKAVIAMVPSNVAWQGVAKKTSTWTREGKDIPFLAMPRPSLRNAWAFARLRPRRVYEEALRDTEAAARGAIGVERIAGHILLVSGTQDTWWPSTPMCESIVKRLDEHCFPHTYRHVALEWGHAVTASSELWPIVTGFLRTAFVDKHSSGHRNAIAVIYERR